MLPESVWRKIIRLVRAAIGGWGPTLRLVTIMVATALCVVLLVL
ncbi:hypothetical protein [Actinokineospora sp. NBRC 105648]|nr:hypothetical protein [Actinokineospora sp. NBRC 105648]GLZ39252.1 hypothetical protein Acsp05_28760 [Actinokineospora sp. NBRC 105648]